MPRAEYPLNGVNLTLSITHALYHFTDKKSILMLAILPSNGETT